MAGTGLGPWDYILLCGISFLGSFIAAAMSLGGGILVLANMALYLPPAAMIPLHGVVPLGSNLGRMALLVRHVLSPVLPAFLAGTVFGSAVGEQLVVSLPTPFHHVFLAGFVLYATWALKLSSQRPRQANLLRCRRGGTVCHHVRQRDGAVDRALRRRRLRKAPAGGVDARHADDHSA